MLGRLGVLPLRTVPLLEGMQLDEIARVATLIGHTDALGWSKRRPKMSKRKGRLESNAASIGFQVLRQGHDGLRDFISRYLQGRPSGQKVGFRFGAPAYFGWLWHAVMGLSSSPAKEIIFQRMVDVGAEQGVIGRKSLRSVSVESGAITLNQLSKKLGLMVPTVRRIAVKLGLVEGSAKHSCWWFTPDDVDLVKTTIADLVTGEVAAELLGISEAQLLELRREGILEPFSKVGNRPKFRRSDMHELLERIRRTPCKMDSQAGIRLTDCCTQMEASLGSLVKRVLAGDLKPVGWVKDGNGLQGCLVAPNCIPSTVKRGRRRAPKGAPESGSSFTDAGIVLGVPSGIVSKLASEDFLKLAEGSSSSARKFVDAQSLRAFHKIYAPAKAYAKDLGCSPTHAYRCLRKLGIISPLEYLGERGGLFVRRSDVTDILGIETCDLQINAGSEHPFWLGLSEYLWDSRSTIRLLHFSGSSARLISGSRMVSAIVTIEEGRISLNIRASRRTARRAYRNLTTHINSVEEVWPGAEIHYDRQGHEISLLDTMALSNPASEGDHERAYMWIDRQLNVLKELLCRSAARSECEASSRYRDQVTAPSRGLCADHSRIAPQLPSCRMGGGT